MRLDFHDCQTNENLGEKVKINRSFNAADDRQLAAEKVRPIRIEFSTSFANTLWVAERIFRSTTKHKRLGIREQFDELCVRSESWTYPLFSKSGLGATRL